MNALTRQILLIGLLICLAPLSACSLLVNFEECTTDSECGDNNTCNDGICEVASACAGQSDCAGANNYCFINKCVTLEAQRCQLGKAFEEDAPIYPIGAVMPTSGTNAARGTNTIAASALAFEQINQSGGAQGTKFGLITCDTVYSPTNAVNEAKYLQSIGVKAIIGGFSSSETVAVANQVAIPGDILLISPASTAVTLSNLQDKDLIWRTVASDALQGPAIGALTKDILSTKSVTADAAKIAVIRVDSIYGNGLQESLVGYWAADDEFKSLTADSNRFQSISFAAGMTIDNTYVDTIFDKLYGNMGLQPDIIILVGSANALNIIALLEAKLTAESITDKPTWILSEALRDPTLLNDMTNFQNVWSRIQGTVISQPDTKSYSQFVSKYGAEKAAQFPFADKAYDAAYILAIATASYAELSNITGKDLAARIKMMAGGTETELISSDFNKASQALATGDSIDIVGASGALDFNTKTGDVFSDISAWSIDTTGAPQFKNGRVLITSK